MQGIPTRVLMGSRALEMPAAFDFHCESTSGNTTSPPILVNTDGPVLATAQCQPTGHALTKEAPLNRKRSAASFVPSTERLQAEGLRWKLIRHAMLCRQVDCSEYPNGVCAGAKNTLSHLSKCKNMSCSFVDCIGTRSMIKHMSQCRAKKCILCGPVVRPATPIIISEQEQEQQQQQQLGLRGTPPLKKRRVTLEN
jgi:hypothetical protein